MNYKDLAENTLNQYVDRHLEDINLFTQFKGLMVSSRGIPMMIIESENSTMILDMDETLVHVLKLSPSLLKLLKEDSHIVSSKSDFKDGNEAKTYAETHVNEFNKVIDGYKYKDSVDIRPHKVFGHALIVFRPLLKEFLDSIESLVGSEDLKDVVVFTANFKWWAEELVSSVNKHTGKKLKLYNGENLHPESMIVDDHEGAAKIKLLKTKVMEPKNMSGIPSQWIRVEAFHGDLKDKELKKTIKKIIAQA
ncbi:MAG: hypothetical protein DRR06_17625 [Gammaproteobacteria bacterium]|nr:MAG: hypothetical protein DRR06_17625 [Gammaproteobacteria bacterium]